MKRKTIHAKYHRPSQEKMTHHPILRKSNAQSANKYSEHEMAQREYHQTRH